jgi:hypothetical protein
MTFHWPDLRHKHGIFRHLYKAKPLRSMNESIELTFGTIGEDSTQCLYLILIIYTTNSGRAGASHFSL